MTDISPQVFGVGCLPVIARPLGIAGESQEGDGSRVGISDGAVFTVDIEAAMKGRCGAGYSMDPVKNLQVPPYWEGTRVIAVENLFAKSHYEMC